MRKFPSTFAFTVGAGSQGVCTKTSVTLGPRMISTASSRWASAIAGKEARGTLRSLSHLFTTPSSSASCKSSGSLSTPSFVRVRTAKDDDFTNSSSPSFTCDSGA
eukprot:CAMPEP_0170331360 /NCGR_PEP_ID=MMETSP0116_2-20130129/66657_1 /TAXON_ID=400756 /ORGANISM="Durinskia baltica, Strain CSIRO CS-38" /LENGTH=104 /DNA_ID=CAMNT_0010584617 /DNA_START=55 /DNA_END=369 /DNA_ORIENTATION=+